MRVWQFNVNTGMGVGFLLLVLGGILIVVPPADETLLRNAGFGIVVLAAVVYLISRITQFWRTHRP